MIKLLLVDDHSLVRIGIRSLLGDVAGFKVVGEAVSGEEAIRLTRQLSPDVVLMDIGMPGIGGLEATLKLQRSQPTTKIVVITARTDILFAQRLLQAGAVGYLTKGDSIDSIIQAIKSAHLGQHYIVPTIAIQLAIKQLTQKEDSPFDQLSKRELQIALMIVSGLQVSSIAKQLYLGSKTIHAYRYRVFKKLGIKNDVDLTRCALEHGFLEETVEKQVY